MSEFFSDRVVLGGRAWFEYHLRRGKRGLELAIKTLPEVEEFMKSLGNGEVESVQMYGNDWFSCTEEPLLVYKMQRNLTEADGYRLDGICDMIVPEPRRGQPAPVNPIINLSFLRIKGISEGKGVILGMNCVISREYARDLGRKINQCSRNLARSYITPFDIYLVVNEPKEMK